MTEVSSRAKQELAFHKTEFLQFLEYQGSAAQLSCLSYLIYLFYISLQKI